MCWPRPFPWPSDSLIKMSVTSLEIICGWLCSLWLRKNRWFFIFSHKDLRMNDHVIGHQVDLGDCMACFLPGGHEWTASGYPENLFQWPFWECILIPYLPMGFPCVTLVVSCSRQWLKQWRGLRERTGSQHHFTSRATNASFFHFFHTHRWNPDSTLIFCDNPLS